MDHLAARAIPTAIAVCPICGAAVWVESIDEVEESDGGALLVSCFAVTCETEPDLDSMDWLEWHRGHFAQPSIDWLPLKLRLEDWLNRPEQHDRIIAIWNAGGAVFPPGKTVIE